MFILLIDVGIQVNKMQNSIPEGGEAMSLNNTHDVSNIRLGTMCTCSQSEFVIIMNACLSKLNTQ